jgi:outer membrane protein OmpA-like peptidoglycan-associated protein
MSFLFLLIACPVIAQYETTVYFDFDSNEVTTAARSKLDSISFNPAIAAIDITGHCDQLGSKQYNYKLSLQRAEAVKNYLVAKGFNANNIRTIAGFGKDRLATDRLDEESRKANRRVTIVGIYKPAAKVNSVQPAAPRLDTTTIRKTPSQDIIQPKGKLVDEITDTATKAGQNIILKNINFYGGSHRFLPTSYNALEDLLDAMQKIPTLVIEIQGHICCIQGEGDGQDNDNFEPFLSYNRARAVYGYLIRNGIKQNRMTYKGYGHKYPIYKIEETEAERTANRRVEIKIVSK